MLLMCLCALLWSIGGLFIKLLPWHPAAICGARSGISAVIIYIYMRSKGYRLVLGAPLVWLSGLARLVSLHVVLVPHVLRTPHNDTSIQCPHPLIKSLNTSALFLRARYSRRELVMVGIVMAGIALFFLDQLTPGGLLGNLLALLSGMTMATMFVTSSRLPDDQSSMSALVLGHCGAGLVGLPFLLLTPVELTPLTISSILVLGVFQLGIPYILSALAVRRCSPLSCSLLGMIEPLLNPVWVLLVLGERPGFFALIGGIIVLGTVTLWSVANARQTA